MSDHELTNKTRFKVGIFTLFALFLIGAMSVYVNDRPFWWRPCQLVHINIADATGLKSKSPIRSLGLQIGYLRSVELFETHVRLGICITAQVEVMPSTRAYIRGEGFLGDKFVELKPVRYVGSRLEEEFRKPDKKALLPKPEEASKDALPVPSPPIPSPSVPPESQPTAQFLDFFIASAHAEEEVAAQEPKKDEANQQKKSSREIPVGEKSQDVEHLVQQVDSLVGEMTKLTNNLREALNPQELRQTMQQLNKTLEHASRTFSPEGSLNTTAQRTLAKLEDAIEQLRDQMVRVNRGEGSVGMLLNDPSYALELKEAFKNINRLLSRVGGVRFIVDVGGEQLVAYDGSRSWFRIGIWPSSTRYYLLGISFDPRGSRKVTTLTTETGGITTIKKETQIEEAGVLLTGMLGKLFLSRIDLAIGVLNSDATLSAGLRLGPGGAEQMFTLKNDLYTRGQDQGVDFRILALVRPLIHSSAFSSLYLSGGLDAVRKINGKTAYSFGAGITFDDEDIKLLFALR